MNRNHLTSLAIIALLATIFLAIWMAETPGTQWAASIGTGLLAVITIRSTVAAARAGDRPKTPSRSRS